MKVAREVLREMLCFDVPADRHLVNIVAELIMVAVGFYLCNSALRHLRTDELNGLRQLLKLIVC